MNRREFLKLGAIATGTFAVAGTLRVGGRAVSAQSGAVPMVDRLVMTNVVDNVYDIFAKGGRLDAISVQRTPLERGAALLAEHGLAYHLDNPKDPNWVSVAVEPVRPFGPVTLKQIKAEPKLAKMEVIRLSRLSVSPVREEEWTAILEMGGGR